MISKKAQPLHFLNGGGTMSDLIRGKDWSATSIGPPEQWPASLRTAVSILLNSQFPMFVWWGEDLITIYNDAYCPIAGEKHPTLLGKSGSEGWKEIWGDLGPLVDSVFSGVSTWSEDQVLYMNRFGYVEETYFTFSYSPIFDEEGNVSGLFCACIETTDKVLATRRIQESERNLRNTILQAPVAMCILKGPSFIVEIANDRMYDLWGRGAEAMHHKPIFDGLPEVRHQGFEELLQQVYKTGERFSAIERPVLLPRSNGVETVYINFLYEPFRDGNGQIAGVIAVAIDATEQTLARKKIEEHREELHLAIDIAKLGTYYVDIPSYTGYYSERVKDWFGFTDDHKDMNLIFAAIHPDDQQRVVFAIEHSLLSPEQSLHDMTYRVQNPADKKERYLRSIGKAFFNSEGKAYQIRGVIQDVTAEIEFQQKIKESEALLQQRVKERTQELESHRNLLDNILQNSSNGISVTEMIRDEEGNVTDATTILANDAAVKFTGLTKELYLSKTAKEIDPDILQSPYGKTCLKTLQTGEPALIQYFLELTGRWLELTISKMDDDHLIHIFTDVTPMKKAQIQLEKSVEDLKRLNENLEEFAYAASHDMKEPIRKIHFFADRLKGELKDSLTENQVYLFERLEHATKRMGGLIDDLLAYSHATKDGAPVEEISLNQKVKNVLIDLELEVQQKGALVTVDPLPVVKGNRRQFQQLFHNLIGNALKYSKPGITPTIHISAKQVKAKEVKENLSAEDANKMYHLIEVKDNGIGFEQKDANRIFNLFTRLHGNSEYRGTGVGLSIVSKVAENHGGFVMAEGKPGEGATFKVLLPAE